MPDHFPYRIFPLGDAAISIDFGNRIDERINDRVMALYQYLRKQTIKGITDLVPAYSSLTLHYDLAAWLPEINMGTSIFEMLKTILTDAADLYQEGTGLPARTVRIPVCYEEQYAPDLAAIASAAKLSPKEVIALHTSGSYHVYMLGFLPGFAYMGQVNEAIAMPRKQRPQATASGSVGIAGRQTGVYPLDSPGGWQIIGRTPLVMFNPESGNTLLQPGDRVQFYAISSHEFDHY